MVPKSLKGVSKSQLQIPISLKPIPKSLKFITKSLKVNLKSLEMVPKSFKWHCLNCRMLKMEFNCATKVPAPTETPREKRAGGGGEWHTPTFLSNS